VCCSPHTTARQEYSLESTRTFSKVIIHAVTAQYRPLFRPRLAQSPQLAKKETLAWVGQQFPLDKFSTSGVHSPYLTRHIVGSSTFGQGMPEKTSSSTTRLMMLIILFTCTSINLAVPPLRLSAICCHKSGSIDLCKQTKRWRPSQAEDTPGTTRVTTRIILVKLRAQGVSCLLPISLNPPS